MADLPDIGNKTTPVSPRDYLKSKANGALQAVSPNLSFDKGLEYKDGDTAVTANNKSIRAGTDFAGGKLDGEAKYNGDLSLGFSHELAGGDLQMNYSRANGNNSYRIQYSKSFGAGRNSRARLNKEIGE